MKHKLTYFSLVGLLSTIVFTTLTPQALPKVDHSDLRIGKTGKVKSNQLVSIKVQEDDKSVLFTARVPNIHEELTITKVIDPDGYPIYDYNLKADEFDGPLFGTVLFNAGEVSLFMPTQPRFKLKPGTYKIAVHSEKGSSIETEAIIKHGPLAAIQQIDLHFWLVTKYKPLHQTQAQAKMIDVLRREINQILKPHHLKLGTTHVSKVSEEMIKKYSEVQPDDNDRINSNLCQQIAQLSPNFRQLNILILDHILLTEEEKKQDAGPTTGLSPGLPGMLPTKQAVHSCVLAALDKEYDFTTNNQSGNIWHESLHFMSLPHTTESAGDEFDYFEDTPKCDKETYDKNEDDIVDTEECEKADVENIMFWEEGKSHMSKEQAWVVQRHPLFYPAH